MPETLKRYAALSARLLLCRECSTRSTGFVIPADEQEDHDNWHSTEMGHN